VRPDRRTRGFLRKWSHGDMTLTVRRQAALGVHLSSMVLAKIVPWPRKGGLSHGPWQLIARPGGLARYRVIRHSSPSVFWDLRRRKGLPETRRAQSSPRREAGNSRLATK